MERNKKLFFFVQRQMQHLKYFQKFGIKRRKERKSTVAYSI
jgi:hypothetical protein